MRAAAAMFHLTFAPPDSSRQLVLDPESPHIELWRDNDGTVAAYGATVDGVCSMHLPGVATFSFDAENPQVTAIADPGVGSGPIVDAYYRTVLPMALQTRGVEVLHASAVRMKSGVVALCAIKETGKSTIAYALSQLGFPLWADDAVPFTINGDSVSALSLPFTIRLRPTSAAFFGTNGIRQRQSPPCDAGAPIDLAPERLAAVVILRRNLFERSSAPPSVARLTASSAFMSTLTHGYCFSLRDAKQRARMVKHYLDLVERVPIFEVSFAAGLEWLPAITSAIEGAIMTTAE